MSNKLANFVEESGPNLTDSDRAMMDPQPTAVNHVGTVSPVAANSNFLRIQDGFTVALTSLLF